MTRDFDSDSTLFLSGPIDTPDKIRRDAVDATVDGEFDESIIADVEHGLARMYLEELNQGFVKIKELGAKRASPRVERLLREARDDEVDVQNTVHELKKTIQEQFNAIDRTDSVNFTKRGNVLNIVYNRILKEQQELERKRLAQERRMKEEEERKLAEQRRQEEEERRRQEEERRKETERLRLEDEKKRRLAEEKEKAAKLAAAAAKEREEKRLAEERLAAEKKREEEAKRQAEAEKAAAAEAEERAANKAFTDWLQVENEFKHYKSIIADMKALNVKTKKDKALNKYCFDKRMVIRPKIGQITTSSTHVKQIAKEIDEILTAAKQEHPEAYNNIMNFFAKIVVKQAEVEVVSNVQQAIPLGFVIAIVLEKHPEVKDIVIARFVKRAPQVIGYSCSIDTEESRKNMGWRKDREDSSKWESEMKYLDKISGITQLWAAINVASVRNVSKAYSLANSWRFLARQLNKSANQTADYHAIAAWWDIAAKDFLQFYGKQGEKLLRLVVGAWASRKKTDASKRLQILGEDWQKTGDIAIAWSKLTS